MFQLLTPKLEQRFKKIGDQRHTVDPIVITQYADENGVRYYAVSHERIGKIDVFWGFVIGAKDGPREGIWCHFNLDNHLTRGSLKRKQPFPWLGFNRMSWLYPKAIYLDRKVETLS